MGEDIPERHPARGGHGLIGGLQDSPRRPRANEGLSRGPGDTGSLIRKHLGGVFCVSSGPLGAIQAQLGPLGEDTVDENAFTFVENEKTIDLADIAAQCLEIVGPTSGITWLVTSREGCSEITMDFRGPRSRRFVMGKRGVSNDCWDPPFLGLSRSSRCQAHAGAGAVLP